MMVLQACVDDSGGLADDRDPFFVLAGFIADSSDWAAFSIEWNQALAEEPRLDYFKMVEANGLLISSRLAVGGTVTNEINDSYLLLK
jgi:hypothetical protein